MVSALAAAGAAAPDDHDLGSHEIGIVVTLGRQLSSVLELDIAGDHVHGSQTRSEAGDAGQTEQSPVGAAVGISQENQGAAGVTAGALAEDHGLGAVFLTDLLKLVLDLIQSLVPGNAGPLALTTGADTAQRILQTVGMISILRHSQRAGAQTTLQEGMALIALNLHQLAVLDVQLNAAAAMAAGATGPSAGLNDSHIAIIAITTAHNNLLT